MNNPADKKHFSLDTNAPLTAQQQAEIATLNALSDNEIDFSDIPPLPDEFWQNAVSNPFYKPTQTVITNVSVDVDILQWLKLKGQNYQACINTILKNEMLREREQTTLQNLNHEH